jgi:hypothetical protein
MAAAGGFSLSKVGFLPFSFAIDRNWMPIVTVSGILRAFLMAGMKVLEFILLQKYIIQPMHLDLAAWHALGCLWMDMQCLELANWSASSMPNGASGT